MADLEDDDQLPDDVENDDENEDDEDYEEVLVRKYRVDFRTMVLVANAGAHFLVTGGRCVREQKYVRGTTHHRRGTQSASLLGRRIRAETSVFGTDSGFRSASGSY